MSLTAALVALAAAVLAALAAHGWWTTRRARRRAPALRAPLAEAARTEPSLDGLPGEPRSDARGDTLASDDGPPTEPMLDDAGAPRRIAAAVRRAPALDALIDALVPLALEAPVAGELVLAHLPATRRAGAKPFAIEGLDAETGAWEPPQPGRRYRELQAGVQLANRSGPLNEIEYSEFVQRVQGFADAVGAAPDFPDMLDIVARAREIDAFASPRDAQLALTLRSDAVAWSVGFLQQSAGRHGFVAGPLPGRWVLPADDDGAPAVLTLVFDAQAALAEDPAKAAVREFQLCLDVPQTPAAAEPFGAWHRLARKLADDMAASVVDDFGEPITVHAFAAIGKELEQLYAQLESRGLPAGSPAARRLFSG